MINKREIFKKFKRNRFLVLAISVIVITGVYYAAQKAIASYNFKFNSDWVEFEDEYNGVEHEEQEAENKGWFEKLFSGDEDAEDVIVGEVGEQKDGVEHVGVTEDNDGDTDDSGKVPENGVDLELEKTIEGETDVDGNFRKDEDGSNGAEEKIYVYITGEVNVPRSCNFKKRKQNC